MSALHVRGRRVARAALAVQESRPYNLLMWKDDAGSVSFDQSRAEALMGKYVLVGITYLDEVGNPKELKQLHGVVETVSEEEGIKIRLKGRAEKDYLALPPDIDTLRPLKTRAKWS